MAVALVGVAKREIFYLLLFRTSSIGLVVERKIDERIGGNLRSGLAVLPVYERTPYLTSAQDPFNVRMEEDIRGRFDSFGRSLVALEKEKQDEKENRERLRKDLWRNISTLRKKGKLSGQRFHFLHINHWTETDQQVFPAELGLVQMTLQDGVTDIFHQKIDPGTSLPLGFKGQIREWSEKTHGLWLDNPELSDNYQEILGWIY